MEELLRVNDRALADELSQVEEHFAMFGDKLPEQLAAQLAKLKSKLG
jgi:GTP-dependent phosphoenolpyruvate carboxykinase